MSKAHTVREVRRTEIARVFELDNGNYRALIGTGSEISGFEASASNADMAAILDTNTDDDAFETCVFVACRQKVR